MKPKLRRRRRRRRRSITFWRGGRSERIGNHFLSSRPSFSYSTYIRRGRGMGSKFPLTPGWGPRCRGLIGSGAGGLAGGRWRLGWRRLGRRRRRLPRDGGEERETRSVGRASLASRRRQLRFLISPRRRGKGAITTNQTWRRRRSRACKRYREKKSKREVGDLCAKLRRCLRAISLWLQRLNRRQTKPQRARIYPQVFEAPPFV